MYAAYGDGTGFGSDFSDIGVAKISGRPGGPTGSQLSTGVSRIWSAGHNRKPTGTACVNGDLCLAVQDLAHDFGDAPAATIARSTDKGRTWAWDRSRPMFGGGVLTTVSPRRASGRASVMRTATAWTASSPSPTTT